jgi:hypothetical protein
VTAAAPRGAGVGGGTNGRWWLIPKPLGADLAYHSDTTWAYEAGHSVLDVVEVDLNTFGRAR